MQPQTAREERDRCVPRTLVQGEKETELAAGQMDQAAADDQKRQGRRAPRVHTRGWRLPLATEVDQSPASNRKKMGRRAPGVLARGSHTAAGQKED